MHLPWLLASDFNQVCWPEDTLSRIQTLPSAEEFINLINEWALLELPIKGQHLTWTNGREDEDVVWEKIDRVFCSLSWCNFFPHSHVCTLPIVATDHAPL